MGQPVQMHCQEPGEKILMAPSFRLISWTSVVIFQGTRTRVSLF